MKSTPASILLHLAAISVTLAVIPVHAGIFFSDFNSSTLPSGVNVYGTAMNDTTGGYTNSGCVKLTTATASVSGSLIIDDLDGGQPVDNFVVKYQAFIGGGTGADGMSFSWANDIPAAAFGEDGAGSGIRVEFDTFKNADPDTAPSIDIWLGGLERTNMPAPGLRAGMFVDVVIQLRSDGTLMVSYNGGFSYVSADLTALNGGSPIAPISTAQFAFGARTGGSTDNHFVDNLSITSANTNAFLASFSPANTGIRPDAIVAVKLADFGTAVDTNTIQMAFDGSNVTGSLSISQANTNTFPYTNTFIAFDPPGLMVSSSSHTVTVTFADSALPPNTNAFQWTFTVSPYAALPTNLSASVSFVDINSPGFFLKYSQIDDSGSRDITRAELQLANILTNGSTSLPYDNLAATNSVDNTWTYPETNVINYSFQAGPAGDFANDTPLPGVPGSTTIDGSKYALQAVTYLHLSPGFYNLGVNSSDGFKLMVADGADIFAPVESIFSSVRAAADSTVLFSVSLDGYYPFRLVYFTGDPTFNPAPGTTTPSLEFFNTDINGTRILINDTNVVGYVPAFRTAQTKPYIRSVNPAINDTGVAGNSSVNATLVDGSLTVQTNSIVLQVNSNTVSPIIVSNAGITTVSYQPPTVFLPNSTNRVFLAFTDSGSNRRTNTWSFTTANIMSPIWSIPAVNNTWVTAGSTERGLAYNPKTGHLLLVSRAASPAPAAGLGIAILDSSNGSVLGTMSTGTIGSSGVGTFKLNMIDVADDGVIYACNLTTSGTVAFQLYRWANENAPPQLVFNANPIGGAARCGDDFRVRRSGAGTQILACGNSAVTTVPIFTTTDGTNFTGTALSISGIAANSLRLGLAFGCGNTLYGETTATPMSYVSYTGLPSTAAALVAQYGIYDKNTNQQIGPIGLDIPNQRIIGNQTVAPHNINLYDVPTLLATPARNFPIDQRNYASQNTSFGTGAVDFTPDGSRVFCLDTGNGIIAFSMAARNAAASICAQPQSMTAPAGNIGFMGVDAIGAPLKYQWRLFGTNLPAGTNQNLDVYYIGPSNIGPYAVVVTNTLGIGGSVTSSIAILDSTMIITQQPASQIIAPGSTAAFTVGVKDGQPAYTYQWKFNGTNLAGATSSTFVTNNVQVLNAGAYTVTITDVYTQTVSSATAVLTVGTAGTGDGLRGDYYNLPVFSGNPPDPFTGPPAFTRVDPTINFNFGTGSPDPSVNADYFTARWSGQVQPFYSQTYNFYTSSDDGSRVWVNGTLVVTNWFTQGPTERSGPGINLTANQKYDIVMEYYEQAVGAVATLSWASPAQTKVIIPQSQLYSVTSSPARPTLTSTQTDPTHLVLSWNGSYVLQTNGDLTVGPWSTVSGATTPFTATVDPATPQLYFRLLSE